MKLRDLPSHLHEGLGDLAWLMSLPCEASPGSSQQESPDAIVANWV
jgi:hypothetical protein